MASTTRSFARAAMKLKPASSSLRTSSRSSAFSLSRQTFRLSNNKQHRFYSSSPPPGSSSSSSSTFIILGTAAVAGGVGYYLYSTGILTSGSAGETQRIFTPGPADYQKVYDAVAQQLEEKDEYDDGSYGPVLVRLAWHASGTFDKETGTGGSNGATMRFAPEGGHGANAGLKAARDFLQPIKEQFPWITYSDLWILAGVAAIQEMHGPVIPWRPGRKDKDIAACTPDGRLPDASKAQNHLRAIFNRMGFNDQEIVALSGAHALGRCHTDRSGFEGPWTFSPTMVTNDYYKLLLEEKWGYRKWNGPKQFQDVKTKTLMMLPTDVAITKDKQMRPWVEKYAKSNELFFEDFKNVILKLFELGVPFEETTQQGRMTFKPSHT